MKKIVCLFLALAMLLSLMAGCGAKAPASSARRACARESPPHPAAFALQPAEGVAL